MAWRACLFFGTWLTWIGVKLKHEVHGINDFHGFNVGRLSYPAQRSRPNRHKMCPRVGRALWAAFPYAAASRGFGRAEFDLGFAVEDLKNHMRLSMLGVRDGYAPSKPRKTPPVTRICSPSSNAFSMWTPSLVPGHVVLDIADFLLGHRHHGDHLAVSFGVAHGADEVANALDREARL